MKVTKIKIADDSVSVAYEAVDDEGKTSAVALIEIKEPPTPVLRQGFEELAQYAAKIVEAGDGWEEGVAVRGVSFAEKKGKMGAIFSCTKTLEHSNSPFNFNTPLKFEAPLVREVETLGDDEKRLLLPPECVAILRKLQADVEAFVKGQRSQMALEFGDDAAAVAAG